MTTFNNDLTSRQWRLHDYLIDNCLEESKHLDEIYNDLSDLYPPIKRAKNFQNSIARRKISDDLTAIDNSKIAQVVITRSSSGIKVATSREEAEISLDIEEIEAKNIISRVSNKRKKLASHGQCRFVFNHERDYFRAYINPSENAMFEARA
jgi:hypothetical protein